MGTVRRLPFPSTFRGRVAAAAAIYAVLTIGWMFPIVVHPESRILYGVSDSTSQLRDYWAAEVQHQNPFTFRHDALTGAPQGRTLAPAISYANAAQPAFVWTLKGALGLVGSWNVFILLGFLLTGVCSFALLDSLGATFGASLFGSYVMTFNPWNFERAFSGHIAFLHEWVFAALIAALLFWWKRGTLRSALVPTVALALCFYMAAYFGLFASFLTFVFFAVAAATRTPVSRLRATGTCATVYGGTLVLLAPTLVLYARERSAVSAIAAHPTAQLTSYGASVWAYLTPYYHHPFLSWITNAVATPGSFTEQTLFYGYSTMILAIVSVVLLVRRSSWLSAVNKRRQAALFAAVLVPGAFIMSLPSKIYGIPMPATLVGHFTTFWRVYARFGILVGIGLAILAAFALTYLTRVRRWWWITPIALVILAFEFLPGHITSFSTTAKPDYVSWLASEPTGIVATYPPALDLGPGIDLSSQQYWYQTLHGQPLFAFFGPGTIHTPAYALRILSRYVTNPLTPGILATEHVKYVVVHDDVYRAEHLPPPVLDARHFGLIKRFKTVRVFSVTGPHIDLNTLLADNQSEITQVEGQPPVTVLYGSGFNPSESYQGTTRRWMINDGVLKISNDYYGSGTTAELTGLVFSNAQPRKLTLVDQKGHVLASQDVPTSEVPLKLGPFTLPRGELTLKLTASPDAATLGPNDPRLATVFISPIEVEPVTINFNSP